MIAFVPPCQKKFGLTPENRSGPSSVGATPTPTEIVKSPTSLSVEVPVHLPSSVLTLETATCVSLELANIDVPTEIVKNPTSLSVVVHALHLLNVQTLETAIFAFLVLANIDVKTVSFARSQTS